MWGGGEVLQDEKIVQQHVLLLFICSGSNGKFKLFTQCGRCMKFPWNVDVMNTSKRLAAELWKSWSFHNSESAQSHPPPSPPNQAILRGLSKRCLLSWLTNRALVYEPKCGGTGGIAGTQPMSTAVHRSPYTHINLGDLSPYLQYPMRLLLPSVPLN